MENKAVYSIKEFCQAHGICVATYHNLINRGEGPRTMKVGARTFISIEAAEAWRRRMEDKAAA